METVKTYEDFLKHYLPKLYEKNKIEKMSLEERFAYYVQKSIKKFKKGIKQCLSELK